MITIPKHIVELYNLKKGQKLNIKLKKKCLIIEL